MTDTIFAVSSGQPPAAIAVIRVSGPAAFAAAERLGGRLPEARRASLRTLKDGAGRCWIRPAAALPRAGDRDRRGSGRAALPWRSAVVAAVERRWRRFPAFAAPSRASSPAAPCSTAGSIWPRRKGWPICWSADRAAAARGDGRRRGAGEPGSARLDGPAGDAVGDDRGDARFAEEDDVPLDAAAVARIKDAMHALAIAMLEVVERPRSIGFTTVSAWCWPDRPIAASRRC